MYENYCYMLVILLLKMQQILYIQSQYLWCSCHTKVERFCTSVCLSIHFVLIDWWGYDVISSNEVGVASNSNVRKFCMSICLFVCLLHLVQVSRLATIEVMSCCLSLIPPFSQLKLGNHVRIKRMFTFLCKNIRIKMSVCVSVCLSVCLFVHVYVCLWCYMNDNKLRTVLNEMTNDGC